MSSYLYCYIEKRNEETNQWENLSLYKKENDKFEPVNAYGGGASACGDLLCGNDFRGNVDCIARPRGIPNDLSPEVKEAWGDGDWYSGETWYDYCELAAFRYALVKYAKKILELARSDEEDTYDDGSKAYWNNVLCNEYEDDIDGFVGFMACIDEVLEKYDIWYPKYGQIRIVVWIG